MAKDAKGHGSDAKGSGSAVHAGSYEALEASRYGPSAHSWSDYGGDAAAAATLAQGHPKSGIVSVHEGAAGRSALNAWGQTPETAKGVRKQLRQDRAQRSVARNLAASRGRY